MNLKKIFMLGAMTLISTSFVAQSMEQESKEKKLERIRQRKELRQNTGQSFEGGLKDDKELKKLNEDIKFFETQVVERKAKYKDLQTQLPVGLEQISDAAIRLNEQQTVFIEKITDKIKQSYANFTTKIQDHSQNAIDSIKGRSNALKTINNDYQLIQEAPGELNVIKNTSVQFVDSIRAAKQELIEKNNAVIRALQQSLQFLDHFEQSVAHVQLVETADKTINTVNEIKTDLDSIKELKFQREELATKLEKEGKRFNNVMEGALKSTKEQANNILDNLNIY